ALKTKWPEANIDVFAHKKTREILDCIDLINNLSTFSKGRAKWYGWFSRRYYDLALVYGHDKSLLRYAKRKSNLTVYFSDISEKKLIEYTVEKPRELMPAQQER
ncbi:glycosyltransferase family 9 protein, partial [Xenorhabdus bovienii]|nr:glycosyltransferase family 9 protein [Xenorhabdus bovienii]